MKQLNEKQKRKRDNLNNKLEKVYNDLDNEICNTCMDCYKFLGSDIKTDLSLALDNLKRAINKIGPL